ncbi:MAG: 1,4-alpha-glucan branching protein GlgB [Deltaproteobacteria bacterium]|nr:1,4-alpha-glucan branching protein GlgB [Deltaproteobacteria bacterium]
MEPTISAEQVEAIVRNLHHDPFQILGPHELEVNGHKNWVVRAFVPDSNEVYVINPETGEEYPMRSTHNEHFFEVVLPGPEEIFMYQYRIVATNGHERFVYDPYFFLPQMGELDLYLFGQGDHHKIYEKLGAHPMEVNGVKGVYFAVWAPNARNVSVIGNFNVWHGGKHQMRVLGSSGVWELFVPDIGVGEVYKYEVKDQSGNIFEKSDPYGFQFEVRPASGSVVADLSKHQWADQQWMDRRERSDPLAQPISIYEVHLGSWMRVVEDGNRFLTYRELAHKLVDYVKEMGYTHLQLLPVAEHPFDASWGYQVLGYFAPTSRFGSPEDFQYFVDYCHQNDIGIIVDWVPAHFPRDAHGLAFFDGTHLYEHADPRKGEHQDWDTKIFNFDRNEVRNFLLANTLFWFEKYHIDGIRVDAVASMLYLDYSRKEGEWIPNQFGGRENLGAIDFLKRLNELLFSYYPGVLSIAEESTAWPGVSRPTYLGGLGFNLKWNMGWMNDFLTYLSKDPVHRKYHHNMITFALLYAFHENFVLVLSHDEVVHGKRALLNKMPGDMWQKFANLRALLAFMFGHPGKKLLFMGTEIGQWDEWEEAHSLDWHLLQYEPHRKLQLFVKELNRLYRNEPALYQVDFDYTGFEWIDFLDSDNSIITFMRKASDYKDLLVFVCNFTPVYREDYRVGVPFQGEYIELLNSDSEMYWGSNKGNYGGLWSDEIAWHNQPYSLKLIIPPLSTMIFKPQGLPLD